MNRFFFLLILSALTLASCSKDDDNEDDQGELAVPANYVFERNGSTTVDFNGQTTRLKMAKELLGSFNDFDHADQESLSNMFANENDPFSDSDLNASSKSIKSKIAASPLYFLGNTAESDAFKADFEGYIEGQMTEVAANRNELAEAGKAGQIADGSKTRYINSKGLEYNQAFAKGLIGALLADQILNKYLAKSVLDDGTNVTDNDNKVTAEGKNYTDMEHKWDEAYGYLYGDPSIPANDPNSVLNDSEDHLLFGYLGKVDSDSDFSGIAEETYQAFKKGRAAIVSGDYGVRDEQVATIRKNLSRVIAVRAVHYLQEGKKDLENDDRGNGFHALSEGYGFVFSLRFTQNPETGQPYLSPEQITAFKEQLLAGNGFWEVEGATLDEISEAIATAFGFTVEQAAD